jgi:beta-lactamase superfamily II metal-dependent hydrolase
MASISDCIAVLDVGHGSCAVLFAGDDVVVIDAGLRSPVLAFLEEQGVKHIKAIYLSHADKDHIGAVVGILSSDLFTVDKVVLNSDSAKKTKVWDDMVSELNRAHYKEATSVQPGMQQGTQEHCNSDSVTVSILAPSPLLVLKGPGSQIPDGSRITSNTVSGVLRIEASGKPVALLPGDVDCVGLNDIKANKTDLSAPVLVFPHHGGLPGPGNLKQFVSYLCSNVSPEIIIFSIGRGKNNTPRLEVVQEIRNALPDVRLVCTQISKSCACGLPTTNPEHLNDVYADGRREGACCGGTIIIPLDNPKSVIPDTHSHEAFITNYIQTPLCRHKDQPAS